MPRKPKDPFAHQHHRGPNISDPLHRVRSYVIGEYVMHIDAAGEEHCFLKAPPVGLPVIGVTVFTQEGADYDLTWTYLRGAAHAALKRLPASSGWHIVQTIDQQAQWKRLAPASRHFVDKGARSWAR
jgi:hypothetical protein